MATAPQPVPFDNTLHVYFRNIMFTRHYLGYATKKDEVDGHVAWMVEKRGAGRVWVGKTEKRDTSEDLGIDGRMILKGILNK
jgi:hypothetical protein